MPRTCERQPSFSTLRARNDWLSGERLNVIAYRTNLDYRATIERERLHLEQAAMYVRGDLRDY